MNNEINVKAEFSLSELRESIESCEDIISNLLNSL